MTAAAGWLAGEERQTRTHDGPELGMKQKLLERLLPGVSAAVPLPTRLPGRGAVPEALGHHIRRGAAIGDRLAERDVAVSGGPAGGELAWRQDILQMQVAIEVQQKSLLVVHPCVDDAERGFAGEGGSLCAGGFALTVWQCESGCLRARVDPIYALPVPSLRRSYVRYLDIR